LRISLHYTNNTSGRNLLAASVGTVEVYAFNSQTEILTAIFEAGANDIARGWIEVAPLPAGSYIFVAWGGSSDDLSRSFSGRRMTDPEGDVHSAVDAGSTSLEEFCMMLNGIPLAGGNGDDIVPSQVDFDDLFWAMAHDVTLTGSSNEMVELDFIRNTSILKVSITGLEHLATRAEPGPAKVFAAGSNGRYRWDNSIDEWAPTVVYSSSNHHLTDSSMSTDVKILRLDKSRHADDPVLLHMEDAANGSEIIKPLDLVAQISRIRDSNGRLRYPDQAAIDREDEFHIDIAITPTDPPGHYPVTGIDVIPDSLTLHVDDRAGLVAVITPTWATDKSVIWSSSDPAIATVDENGVVTALKPGRVTITATTVDGEKTASCIVTVIPGTGGDPVPVTGIEVWPGRITLAPGGQTAVTAIVGPDEATNKNVVWTSSNPAVATVDQWGRVTAVGPGVAVITATTVDGSFSDSCTVTVTGTGGGEDPGDPDDKVGIKVTITIQGWEIELLDPIV
jgi:uncharacterized protein YjdB